MTGALVRVEIPGVWDASPAGRASGAALSGWLYAELALHAPERLEVLQGLGSLRPYSVAMVGRACPRLVITGYGPLAEAVAEIGGRVPERLLLSGRWWRPTGPATASGTTWSALALPLLAPEPPSRARLAFLTPTTFRVGRVYTPLPEPELVLGGLLERWQRWAEIDLGPGARDVVASTVVLRRFAAHSVIVRVPAFVGWAEWAMRFPPPAYGGLLAVLARFAEFAGVGHNAQVGFGCVQLGALPELQPGGTEASGGEEHAEEVQWPSGGSSQP